MATCTCRKCKHQGDYTAFPKLGGEAPWCDVKCPKCGTWFVDTTDVQMEVAALGVAYMFGKHNFNLKRAEANTALIPDSTPPETLAQHFEQGYVTLGDFKKFTFPLIKEAFPKGPSITELMEVQKAPGQTYADFLSQMKNASVSSGSHTKGKPKQAYPYVKVWGAATQQLPAAMPGITPGMTPYRKFLNWLGQCACDAVDHTKHGAGYAPLEVATTSWNFLYTQFGWDLKTYVTKKGIKSVDGFAHGQWEVTILPATECARFFVTVTEAMRKQAKAKLYWQMYGGDEKAPDPDDPVVQGMIDKMLGNSPVVSIDPDGMTTNVQTVAKNGDVYGPSVLETIMKWKSEVELGVAKPPIVFDSMAGVTATWGDEKINPADIKFTPHNTVNIQAKPHYTKTKPEDVLCVDAQTAKMLSGDCSAIEAKALAHFTGNTAAHLVECAWEEACKAAGPNNVPSSEDVEKVLKTYGVSVAIDKETWYDAVDEDAAALKALLVQAVVAAMGKSSANLYDPTGKPPDEGWTVGVDYAKDGAAWEETAKQSIAMFSTVSNPLAPAPEAKPWVVACLVGPDYMAHPELPWTMCGAGDCDGDVVVWDVPKNAKPFMLCGVVFLDEDGGVQYSEFPHANAGPCVVVPAPGQSWTMKAPTNTKPVSHLAGVLTASLHAEPEIKVKKTKASRRAVKSKKKIAKKTDTDAMVAKVLAEHIGLDLKAVKPAEHIKMNLTFDSHDAGGKPEIGTSWTVAQDYTTWCDATKALAELPDPWKENIFQYAGVAYDVSPPLAHTARPWVAAALLLEDKSNGSKSALPSPYHKPWAWETASRVGADGCVAWGLPKDYDAGKVIGYVLLDAMGTVQYKHTASGMSHWGGNVMSAMLPTRYVTAFAPWADIARVRLLSPVGAVHAWSDMPVRWMTQTEEKDGGLYPRLVFEAPPGVGGKNAYAVQSVQFRLRNMTTVTIDAREDGMPIHMQGGVTGDTLVVCEDGVYAAWARPVAQREYKGAGFEGYASGVLTISGLGGGGETTSLRYDVGTLPRLYHGNIAQGGADSRTVRGRKQWDLRMFVSGHLFVEKLKGRHVILSDDPDDDGADVAVGKVTAVVPMSESKWLYELRVDAWTLPGKYLMCESDYTKKGEVA